MKNKRTLLILLLIFVFLLGGAALLYRQLGQSVETDQLAAREEQQQESGGGSEPEQKTEAPDFTVYDREGREVRLSDYTGKPIVLNFWASWCGPCQSEMPDFHEKYLELGDEIQFLMVNATDGSRETVETASAFVEENAYTFPVLYDTQSLAAYAYGAYSLPSTFFIDADGYLVARAAGAIDGETLQRGIDMIAG